jgi:outer membrane protein assembly factor BamB
MIAAMDPRARLVPLFALGLSAGTVGPGCTCGGETTVPFHAGGEPTLRPVDPAATLAPLEASAHPDGTREIDLESSPLRIDAGVIRASALFDFDRDGDRDALIVVLDAPGAAARVLYAERRGSELAPLVSLASRETLAIAGGGRDVACTPSGASLTPLSASLVLATIESRCEDESAPRLASSWVLSADERPRALELFELAGRAEGEGLAFAANDRDHDGHDDLEVEVRIATPSIPVTSTLTWMSRAAGLAREGDQPEPTLSTLSTQARELLRRNPDEAIVAAERAIALRDAICREAERPRLFLGGARGVPCGTSASIGRAYAMRAAALARRLGAGAPSDPAAVSAALEAYVRLDHHGVSIREGDRALVRESWLRVASVPPARLVVHRAGEASPLGARRAPRLSSLAFLDESRLLVRGADARVLRVEGETLVPDTAADLAARAESRVLDPDGALELVAIERSCEGTVVVIAPASGIVDAVTGGRREILVAPRAGPGCRDVPHDARGTPRRRRRLRRARLGTERARAGARRGGHVPPARRERCADRPARAARRDDARARAAPDRRRRGGCARLRDGDAVRHRRGGSHRAPHRGLPRRGLRRAAGAVGRRRAQPDARARGVALRRRDLLGRSARVGRHERRRSGGRSRGPARARRPAGARASGVGRSSDHGGAAVRRGSVPVVRSSMRSRAARAALAAGLALSSACAASPDPVGPCTTDVQCRHDRICHEGRCRFHEEVRAELAARAQAIETHGSEASADAGAPTATDAGGSSPSPDTGTSQAALTAHARPVFMGDARHTGRASATAPTTLASPTRLHRTSARIYAAPVEGADGTLYVGSLDHGFAAIARDGTLRWRYTGGDRFYASAVVLADGTVVVGNHDGTLAGLDAQGRVRWRLSLGGPIDASPTLDDDETVYVPATGLYAVDGAGRIRWHVAAAGEVRTPPAVHPQGLVLFASVDGVLHAVRRDGSVAWDATLGASSDSGPAIADDGTIVIGDDLGHVTAFDASGQRLWQVTTGADVRATPAIARDGTIVVGSDDRNVYGIAPDGTVRWRYATGGRVRSSARIDAAGHVYVGSQDDFVYALGLDGTLVSRHNLGQNVDATALVAGDGRVIVGTDDGSLYAFSP